MKRFVISIILLVVLAAIGLVFAFPDNAREYGLYFTEKRPSLELTYSKISQEWTETQLRGRFPQLQLKCYDNRPGEYLDDRSCFADIGSHNGSPAMGIAFYLASGKLNHVGVAVPWWAHGRQTRELVRAYGTPLAAQPMAIAGVSLAGWELNNGNAVFFNRNPQLNPLMWSLVLWSSDRACRARGCFIASASVQRTRNSSN